MFLAATVPVCIHSAPCMRKYYMLESKIIPLNMSFRQVTKHGLEK